MMIVVAVVVVVVAALTGPKFRARRETLGARKLLKETICFVFYFKSLIHTRASSPFNNKQRCLLETVKEQLNEASVSKAR